jgi:GT2 family glycosyltransferase
MQGISIIIVSWNAREFLSNCLKSIRTSGGPNVQEIIVVDNGSTDGSPQMVAQDFPEVKLIQSKENLGFARANNLGLKEAAGTWVALINSDVIVHEGCLQQLETFLQTHPEVGLVGPRIVGGDGQLQRTCRRLPTLWNMFCRCVALDSIFPRVPIFSGREMRHWAQDSQREIEVLSGCFWMGRRSAIEQVGGLDERFFFYAEDVDWCKRFWQRGWKVVFVPTASATHFGGGSSANAPLRYSIEMLRANLVYWRKHFGILGQAAFGVLSLVHHVLRLGALTLKRAVTMNSNEETAQKWKRSWVCLWWLLTGTNCAIEEKRSSISARKPQTVC